MTLWDVNGTTLKRKSPKDKNTSRIYAKFGKEIYVAANLVSLIQSQIKL